MTEIEKKALALVNEVERQEGLSDLTPRIMRGLVMDEALCRAIEQHEAFRQEVSDAAEQGVEFLGRRSEKHPRGRLAIALARFIIAKPDPLVDAVQDWWDADGYNDVANLRAAIEKRGGKIVWGEG